MTPFIGPYVPQLVLARRLGCLIGESLDLMRTARDLMCATCNLMGASRDDVGGGRAHLLPSAGEIVDDIGHTGAGILVVFRGGIAKIFRGGGQTFADFRTNLWRNVRQPGAEDRSRHQPKQEAGVIV